MGKSTPPASNPKKYELIRIVRDPPKFNMAAAVTIAGETRAPKQNMRVLVVQIDMKLKWGLFVKKIQGK